MAQTPDDPTARRKSEAEAAKIEAEVFEKQLNNRAKQMEMARSTTTVEGTLVENNIAASKAVGCAAADISRLLRGSYPLPTLVLYSQNAANGLSEYSALRSQIERLNSNYPARVAALRTALDNQTKRGGALTAAERRQLENRQATVRIQISGLRSRHMHLGVDMIGRSQITALEDELATIEQKLSADSSMAVATSMAGPVNPLLGVALSLMPLFKTETEIKGTAVESTDAELLGYLYRFMSDGDRGRLKIVSPDTVMLDRSVAETSALLRKLTELSTEHAVATAMVTRAAAIRKQVTDAAATKLGKAAKETELALRDKALSLALDAYAAKPNSEIRRAEYERARLAQKAAGDALALALKAINIEGSNLDKAIERELLDVQVLNSQAEEMVRRLSGTALDKPVAGQKLLGDYLRSEVLYDKLNEAKGRGPQALWLELDIAASGANQKKKSNFFVDFFRQGPSLSYSGGSVVTYRLIEGNGQIFRAGTVWSFTPYQRSSKMMQFECMGSGRDGLRYPIRNL